MNTNEQHDAVSQKELKYLEYLNRENEFHHMAHDEDMTKFVYLKQGNLQAIQLAERDFNAAVQGHLSDDPLRNIKYLFVASVALACRYATEGGLDLELSHNASDLYIQKMDKCRTEEEVIQLHTDMFRYYTTSVATLHKKKAYPKAVSQCMDYIYYHLNEPIHTSQLSEITELHSSYLSTLFKKETGMCISEYIMSKKIEAASNMLRYSDYSYSEISTTLAFSSQSHFTQIFKKYTGYTPKQYRNIDHDSLQ